MLQPLFRAIFYRLNESNESVALISLNLNVNLELKQYHLWHWITSIRLDLVDYANPIAFLLLHHLIVSNCDRIYLRTAMAIFCDLETSKLSKPLTKWLIRIRGSKIAFQADFVDILCLIPFPKRVSALCKY